MARIAELDALRGIASLVILFYHLKYVFKYPLMGTAVDLFFVLSGYLITGILLAQAGGVGGVLRRFYWRRALRIFPIYYLALGVVVAAGRLQGGPASVAGWPEFAAYLQNVPLYFGRSPAAFPSWFHHTWSLAVEEQFYLLWPLAVLALGPRRLAPAILMLVPVPIVMRWRGFPESLLLTRCDGLLAGALLAVALRWSAADPRRRPATIGLLVAALGLGVFSLGLWGRASHDPGGELGVTAAARAVRYALLCAGFAGLVGLVVLHSGRAWLGPLRWRPLVGLGMISYGLYLYHPPINALVHHALVVPGHLSFKTSLHVKVALALAVAVLSWVAVERPIARWRDRLADRGPARLAHEGHRRVDAAETGPMRPHLIEGVPGRESPAPLPGNGHAARDGA